VRLEHHACARVEAPGLQPNIGMSRNSEPEDDRKRKEERGYTRDGGGGHAGGGGKRRVKDEKKQTTGRPSPRRGGRGEQ
jgi:hypothetical protein